MRAPSSGWRPRLSTRADNAQLPVWERPTAGSVVPVGTPVVLRVLSGDWRGPTLSPLDYQAVRFTVDGAPVATVTLPRLELRTRPNDGTQTLVPLWETSWIPPQGREGTAAVFRAEAVDRAGLTAPVQALVVSLSADTAPFISPLSPSLSATVTATNAVPLEFLGTVGDDTMSQGLSIELRIDGATVAQARLFGGTNSASSGSAPYRLTWTPTGGPTTTPRRAELVATDVRGLFVSVAYDVMVVNDRPPTVSITSPANQSLIVGGSRATFEANVLDDSPGLRTRRL